MQSRAEEASGSDDKAAEKVTEKKERTSYPE
jgi:hypothetical protein